MIIFLYGPNTYKSKEKLKEIINRYKSKHPKNLELRIYDSENLDFQKFKDELKQKSIFQEKKLIILKNVFFNEDFKKQALKNKDIFLGENEIIVFFEEGKVAESNALTKFLKKNGQFQKFEELESLTLENWIEKEFVKKGKKIEKSSVRKLIKFTGNNLWRISNEIEKLSSFKEGEIIASEDIELLVRPEIETEIFQTIDALARKDKKTALAFIEKHIEKGDSPFYLLSMIAYQYRVLILTKIRAGQEFGINYYVLKKTSVLINRFSLEELKKAYKKLFLADIEIKTGKISPEKGIEMLIAVL